MSDYLLAIDVGTQSARALVFNLDGRLQARTQVPFQPYVSPQPGWAEQSPDLYWRALGEACRSLWRDRGVAPADIRGVALTTQRATAVVVDRDGRPLRDAIVWLDQRRASGVPPVGGLWSVAFRLAGVASTVAGFQRKAPDNWLAQHEPATWKNTHRSVLLSGYLTYRLVGEWMDAVGAQVGYLPFDYRHQRWAGARDWKWSAVATRRAQLPELVPSGAPLGSLTAEAGAHLGLPAGLPLIAAGSDKACEMLGAGCLRPDQACLSLGTAATVNTCRTGYLEVTRHVPPYPAAVPGAYSTEVPIDRGFWLVSWFREQFGAHESAAAAARGVAPEAVLDEAIADIPPGSLGLILQPTWSPGVRVPGPEAKGAIVGFGEAHTRAHVYRAVLEGLAYGLREGAERIERRARQRLTTLRVAGGGAQSDAMMQILADVFGMPAQRPHLHDASGLGAAINAAVGLGYYRDHHEAVAHMTHAGDRFEPRASARQTYDALYRRVYRRLYRRLRPLYRDIRRITDYPPA